MSTTKAAAAFARLSSVLTLLHAHPDGLRVDYLAAQVGVPESRLRDELLAYYAADTLTVRPDTLLFTTGEGREDDPHSAEVVRVVSERPAAELGVELMPVRDWLRAYQSAAWISQMQPENRDLAEALDIIGQRILSRTPPHPDSAIGAVLSAALHDRVHLDLEYSRAWLPGVVSRRVAPLRLVQTARGWELDTLCDGEVRTFLIDRIRSATPTSEPFEVPAGIDARLRDHRRVTAVDLSVPQGWQSVVDRYAESSEVLRQDEDDALVRGAFLPPVDERIGMILVSAPGSFVVAPGVLNEAGPAMAQLLLAHHGLTP